MMHRLKDLSKLHPGGSCAPPATLYGMAQCIEAAIPGSEFLPIMTSGPGVK